MSDSSSASRARGGISASADEVTYVRLAPYKETPDWYRTTTKLEGHKRWFEKSKVSVVARDTNTIVLSMPKAYADTRQGISSLVVNEPAVSGGAASGSPSVGKASEGRRPLNTGVPKRLFIQMGPGGRIVIPSDFRDAMQVKDGEELMARVVDGELRLITPPMAVRLAQKIVRETIPGDDSLADALIEERRKEFEREMSDG
jgi:bifunctional DNA-binding transcriptional regulator/antitoxin component of YhaV-PrlF toxin-antitoxin module